MSQFGRLVLNFSQRPGGPARLEKTVFALDGSGGALEAERGLYGRSFKWSAATKALSVLLIGCARDALSAAPAGGGAPPPRAVLRGRRRSMAASLSDALTKKQRWLYDVSGGEAAGLPRLAELIRRKNADFNTDPEAPVELWLDTGAFPADRVEVLLNGRRVESAGGLEELAADVEAQWRPGGRAAPAGVGRAELSDRMRDFDPGRAAEFFEWLAGHCADDVEMVIKANEHSPFGGAWRGRSEVIRASVRNYGLVDVSERHLHTLLADSATTASFEDYDGVVKARRAAYRFSQSIRLVLREGLVSKIRILSHFDPAD